MSGSVAKLMTRTVVLFGVDVAGRNVFGNRSLAALAKCPAIKLALVAAKYCINNRVCELYVKVHTIRAASKNMESTSPAAYRKKRESTARIYEQQLYNNKW